MGLKNDFLQNAVMVTAGILLLFTGIGVCIGASIGGAPGAIAGGICGFGVGTLAAAVANPIYG